MPENVKPESSQQQQVLPMVQAEKFATIYANSANAEVTAWDFKIIFGEIKKSQGKLVIEQSVQVTMSPQHAKALAEMLTSNVREYERSVGEIKLPQTVDTHNAGQPKVPAVEAAAVKS
jgi:hypothetical protein